MNQNKPTLSSSSYETILQDASKKSKGVLSFKRTYPAFGLLVILLVLSFLTLNLTTQLVKGTKQAEFEKATTSIMNRLDTKYQRKNEILKSMSGLYDILPQVVKDYFELYGTVPSKTYPSILSFIYVPQIEQENLGSFVFNARSQGYYDYKVHPEGNRETYYLVEHVVPLIKNKSKLGLDLGVNPAIKKTILKARDENSQVSSPTFEIRKDTMGFYLFSPIYKRQTPRANLEQRKENFTGVIALEILAKTFIEKALEAGGDKSKGQSFPSDTSVIFRIYDVDDKGQEIVVYESDNVDLLNTEYEPDIKETLSYKLADRSLRIDFATIPGFGGEFRSLLPLITFIISIVLSFAFFGFLYSVLTSKARAIDLADRMTRSQRRIVDTSKDIIAVMDFDGKWRSMNAASKEVLGYDSEEMMNVNLFDMIINENDKRKIIKDIESATGEITERMDIKMKGKEGILKWVNWSFTFSHLDELVYAIGRDVTIEKQAEEQAILRSKQIQLAELFAREASESKTYFMTKLSHQLRNSLTSIIGYLQLVSNKAYETDEERDTFVKMAEDSSEEVFTFVSDITDATSSATDESSDTVDIIKIGNLQDSVKKFINNQKLDFQNISLEYLDESSKAKMFADSSILTEIIKDVAITFSTELEKSEIKINAQENSYEGRTEIQILGSSNSVVHNMINIYKENQTKIIDQLDKDKHDILLKLATIGSNVRRMNGTITIDTFGEKDNNVVIISLPLNKTEMD